MQNCTAAAIISEPDVKTAVRVYFKIKITVTVGRHKKEFQAAVFMDRRQRCCIFGTNMLLRSPQVYIEILLVIAELSICPDSAIRFPQDTVNGN